MASPLVSDELWAVIEPLLPVIPARPKGGRPRVSYRSALTGIVFVLLTDIPWEMLPHEMGCGSGITCWRRLRDWPRAGIWDGLHRAMLTRLYQVDRLDWSRACMDSASIAAKRGVKRLVQTPRIAGDRARNGTSSRIDRVFR